MNINTMRKRCVVWSFFALCTVGIGCGDDESEVDAGTQSGGSGGRGSETGGSGGSAGTSGAATGGAGGVEDGGGGQARINHAVNKCWEPIIEPGDDACRECALEYCCMHKYAGSCLSPPVSSRDDNEAGCYRDLVQGCIVNCYKANDNQDVDSWSIVKECVDLCQTDGDDTNDAGTDEFDFPVTNSSAGDLVECIVGSDDAAQSPCVDICFPNWRNE